MFCVFLIQKLSTSISHILCNHKISHNVYFPLVNYEIEQSIFHIRCNCKILSCDVSLQVTRLCNTIPTFYRTALFFTCVLKFPDNEKPVCILRSFQTTRQCQTCITFYSTLFFTTMFSS